MSNTLIQGALAPFGRAYPNARTMREDLDQQVLRGVLTPRERDWAIAQLDEALTLAQDAWEYRTRQDNV